jgi:CelD/BcsL family acetyltransferase involved in cellulose biosynthesis
VTAAARLRTEVSVHRDLRSIASEWQALCARAVASPFQRPEWLGPWHETFGGELHVVTVRRDGALVGVLPLRRASHGLELLGVGISDHPGGVFLDDDAADDALAAIPAGSVFDDQVEGSTLLRVRPRGLRGVDHDAGVAPCLDLSRGLEAIPAKLRDRLAYERRRLGRRGGHLEVAADPARAIEDLFRLHAARWRTRGQQGVLADPAVQRFHRAAVPRLARAGVARFHVLSVEGDTVGVLYALQTGPHAHYYLSGFDPEVSALGPGVLMVGAAIDDALARGANSFDFLRGAEPYKYAWGAVDRRMVRRVLA